MAMTRRQMWTEQLNGYKRRNTRLVRTIVVTGALMALTLLAITFLFDTWAVAGLLPLLIILTLIFWAAKERQTRLANTIALMDRMLHPPKDES